MKQPITTTQRRSRLTAKHRLGAEHRIDDVVRICDDLVGFHSTDPATVFLSAAARMAHPSIQAIQEPLYVDRALVRHHAMRRTLWVHSIPQARVAHSATTTKYAESERKRMVRMLEEGAGLVDGDRWYQKARSAVLDTLADRPGLTTRQLGELLPDLGVRIVLARGKSYEGTQAALSRVLLQMGFEGAVTRVEPSGSWNNSQYKWQLAEDWLPAAWTESSPDIARQTLVSWWLGSYGPGSERDIAWWMGLPLGMTRKALAGVGAVEVDYEGMSLWIHPETDADSTFEPSVAFLPGLDSTTMGWKERDWYLDGETKTQVFDSNGNAGPTVWVDGEIVGGWIQGDGGSLRYRLTRDVGREARDELEERAHSLEQLWGGTRFKVRFPVPIQKTLL